MVEIEEVEHRIDASTFQKPLGQIAEVLAQKVKREALRLVSPSYVATDLHVLTRQAMCTYDTLFYINADERRETDCYWKTAYSVVTLPLIRNMIDCLYNITAILQDPGTNGPWFRRSGFRKAFTALKEDEERYGGQPRWDRWIEKNRDGFEFEMRGMGLTVPEVLAQAPWPTMGKYVMDKGPGGTLTTHQEFLKTFTYGKWREYSAIAHGAFEGLMHVAMYYIGDSMPHEARPKIEALYPKIISMHLARAASILLCVVTELQAYFKFDDDGARINERIRAMWDVLNVVPETKELYDERYSGLMKDKGIIRD